MPTELHCFPGTFHGFLLIPSAVTTRARDMMSGALRRGLGMELPPGPVELTGAGAAEVGTGG